MNKPLQSKILETILAKFPKRSAFVEALTSILGIGKDSIYRRLRGETSLTPEEISILSKEFKISIDSLIQDQSDTIFCTYNSFSKKINTFSDYLIDVKEQIEKVIQLPDYQAYYASYEIQFFYYCLFPELINFKLYAWGLTVFDFDFLQKRPFDFEVLPYPDLQLIQEMLVSLKKIDSTELWSLNIVENTLNQIEYFFSSGRFRNPNDAIILCDKLEELMNHFELMAEHGCKFLPGDSVDYRGGKFDLYHNELLITSNMIYITSPSLKLVYSILSNPNYLLSTDEKFGQYQEEWFKKAISKSESISNHAEKKRSWFFNKLRQKINRKRQFIQIQIGEEED